MAALFSELHRVVRSAYQTNDSILIEHIMLTEPFPLHWHDHFELQYIVSGSGIHLCNGKTTALCPGTFHFVLPTDIHALTVSEPVEIIKLIFDESNIDPAVYRLMSGIPPEAFFCFEGETKALFDTLFRLCATEKECYADTEQYPLAAKRMLELILLHLISYCRENRLYLSGQTTDTDAMGSVLAYLHRNFRRKVTLAETAAYVHFSPSYLSKCFRETVGITFKAYLTTLRLQFAEKLLCSTACTVTEVCYESGFGSLSHFINAFHSVYGMSPTAYRKNAVGITE